MHRSYNFNGTFYLPSGGKTIGDGGPVESRLSYIPDLTGKSFLDIGSEEGYAVFDALKKNAKFAKGLNILETKEYDFFPEHSRPDDITTRSRDEINKTQKFLSEEHNLGSSNKIKFDQDISSPWAIETIKRCKKKYMCKYIDFVIGSDLLAEICLWKNIIEFLRSYQTFLRILRSSDAVLK